MVVIALDGFSVDFYSVYCYLNVSLLIGKALCLVSLSVFKMENLFGKSLFVVIFFFFPFDWNRYDMSPDNKKANVKKYVFWTFAYWSAHFVQMCDIFIFYFSSFWMFQRRIRFTYFQNKIFFSAFKHKNCVGNRIVVHQSST